MGLSARGLATAAFAAIALLAPPAPAVATPRGVNGVIVCDNLSDSPAIEDRYLYTVDPAQGRMQNITLDRFLWSGPAGASWSPNGRQLAFAGPPVPELTPDLVSDIFVNDLGHPRSRNLTRTPFAESDPAWSPDGRYIAYTAPGPGGDSAIWRMRPDGSSRQLLVAGGSGAAWSPDGRRLAFSLNGAIYTSDGDGGARRRVIANGTPNAWPSWSPDGRRIAWSRGLAGDGKAEIWVASATGGSRRRLTRNDADDLEPSWSPDGRFIAVARAGGPADLLYVIATGSRRERHLGVACSGPDWQRRPGARR